MIREGALMIRDAPSARPLRPRPNRQGARPGRRRRHVALAGCSSSAADRRRRERRELDRAPVRPRAPTRQCERYTDGTYTADGLVPDPRDGREDRGDDHPRGRRRHRVEVTGDPQAPETERYQGEFIDGIAAEVVGKSDRRSSRQSRRRVLAHQRRLQRRRRVDQGGGGRLTAVRPGDSYDGGLGVRRDRHALGDRDRAASCRRKRARRWLRRDRGVRSASGRASAGTRSSPGWRARAGRLRCRRMPRRCSMRSRALARDIRRGQPAGGATRSTRLGYDARLLAVGRASRVAAPAGVAGRGCGGGIERLGARRSPR